MEEIKIFREPMTDKQRSANLGLPLKMPSRYHLIDCLKDLKFGRPAENQHLIQKWIDEMYEEIENGVPFT
jgi:hypothetical protein